jgi:hypothetical protein
MWSGLAGSARPLSFPSGRVKQRRGQRASNRRYKKEPASAFG